MIARAYGSADFVDAVSGLLSRFVGEKIDGANRHGVRVLASKRYLGKLEFRFVSKAGGLVRVDCDLNHLTGRMYEDTAYINQLMKSTMEAIEGHEMDKQQRTKLYLDSH